jgi:hypothetical protein
MEAKWQDMISAEMHYEEEFCVTIIYLIIIDWENEQNFILPCHSTFTLETSSMRVIYNLLLTITLVVKIIKHTFLLLIYGIEEMIDEAE